MRPGQCCICPGRVLTSAVSRLAVEPSTRRLRTGERMAASVGQAELASPHSGLEAGAGLERGHQLGDPPPVGAH
jgi:hypothetical protein